MIPNHIPGKSVCFLWRSDEGVAPYRGVRQPKHPDKPEIETQSKSSYLWELPSVTAFFHIDQIFSISPLTNAIWLFTEPTDVPPSEIRFSTQVVRLISSYRSVSKRSEKVR